MVPSEFAMENAPSNPPRRSRAETPIVGATEHAAQKMAQFAFNKKAEDIVVLDVRGLSTFTDFLIVCSGTSEPHLKAIATAIREGMRETEGVRAHSEDGSPGSQWIVLDYVDVVVHLFASDKRAFYGMEDLWGDAPRLALHL